MISWLRDFISPFNPLRLFYHKVIAYLAAIIYRFPARHLKVIAVTGTSGKTSTCHFIAEILQEAGHKTGMATTIGFRIGNKDFVNATKMTTVGRFALQKLLRMMVDAGCEYALVETTSHALMQSRLAGVSVDTAVMTNMFGDHIEYHGNFENYRDAKAKLFQMVGLSKRKGRTPKRIILNADDSEFSFFDQFSADQRYTYGIEKPATCTAKNIVYESSGSRFILQILQENKEVHLNLPGIFNIYNALAAAMVGVTENISLQVIADALRKIQSLPGRFEHVDAGQPFTVVVDYAHATDALEGLLKVYKNTASANGGKLFVVFGAVGGGRDKGKRPKMGAAAHAIADYVIVTTDDPYTEDEWEIIDMVVEGIPRKEGERFWKIASRRAAIQHALMLAQKGDVVVIAGKGCEPVQLIYGERRKWDDREVVREILGSK